MTNERKRVVALGFFDGVHIGHGALLSLCAKRAAERNAVPAAFTFDVHPSTLITGRATPLLSTPEDRAGLMKRIYGIQDVAVARYDRAMMTMPWRDFVTEYLVKDLNAVHLVAGHDFHFGYKGEGDPQRLQELCAELGIGCDIVSKVELEGKTVSSTYIRSLVAEGDMARAVEYLGHPHVLTAEVQHGKRLGTKLGFPTVNLPFPKGVLMPARGVYVTRAVLENGESYPAVTNVGIRPTVEDGEIPNAEGWLLDFNGDLYGQKVRLEFYHYLRSERKFDSLDDLRAMVLKNGEETRAFFAN